MDIALLNLANVLHRSKHSRDATVPLHVAVSLAPNVNVLHYTLGNIYAVSNSSRRTRTLLGSKAQVVNACNIHLSWASVWAKTNSLSP